MRLFHNRFAFRHQLYKQWEQRAHGDVPHVLRKFFTAACLSFRLDEHQQQQARQDLHGSRLRLSENSQPQLRGMDIRQ